MAEDDQINPKRFKLDEKKLQIAEDLPNTKLCVTITHKLYQDQKTADIYFLFETNDSDVERVPAHKLILSTGSEVFETMFHGSIPEGNEVKILNGTASAFKEFLQFFYLDKITMTTENIAQVMNFVRQYGIERCMVQCIDFLKDTMTNNDVCSSYQLAIQFELEELKRFCERKISGNAEDVLKTDDFLDCDGNVFQHIMQMDSLMCEEKFVFDASVEWSKKSCEKNGLDAGQVNNLREQLSATLHLIHFRRMKFEDFVSRNAKYEGLFSISELTDIMRIIAQNDFKSNLFTTKALSNEIFTWDEERVSECSLSDKLRIGKRPNKINESFTLSCNEPLLLNKIKFAAVNPISCYQSSGKSKINIEIFQKQISEYSAISNTGNVEKPMFQQPFHISSEKEVLVEFSKPFLILPSRSYEIKLTCSTYNEFAIIQLSDGKIEFDDLPIIFTANNGVGLVRAIFFNRI